MLLALMVAASTTSSSKGSGSSSWIILVYVAIFAALYFFYLRPRSRRQKAQRVTDRKVGVGDRAQTIGGFVGTVVKNDGDLVRLRTDGGVELDFLPSAIARPYSPPATPTLPEQPAEGDPA